MKEQEKNQATGLCTIEEASRYLAVSRAMLYKLMDNGTLRYAKIGKSRRLRWKDVEELAEAAMVTA